jgi:hypothetical protein
MDCWWVPGPCWPGLGMVEEADGSTPCATGVEFRATATSLLRLYFMLDHCPIQGNLGT